MLTSEQLHTVMPQLPAAKRAMVFPFLAAAIDEFAIGQPARTAAFLAQLAHESGQLRFMEELWGPTPAQRRYEPPGKLASNLGNIETGDGRRFKGRGPIQITGRANYRRFGDLLGLDLVGDPARAALPEVTFRIAGLLWSKKGLNELADQVTAEAFREITRRIKGGFNGLADRERFYQAAKTALRVTPPPISRDRARVPGDIEEPAFERGHEAIRSDRARGARRKAAASNGRRKTRSRQKARSPKRVKRANKRAARTKSHR